jgi:hypothetical protein
MSKISSLFWAVLVIVMSSNTSFAVTVNCDRTTSSTDGFTTREAFNSWFPKSKQLDGAGFKEAGGTSKAMVSKRISTTSNGARVEQIWRLLPNNLLIGRFKPFGNFRAVDNIRYKCDINSNELRLRLAQSTTTPAAPSTSASTASTKGCFGGNLKACDNDVICNKATSARSGSQKWETTSTWEPYVKEAKSRGLICGVVDSASSTSKIDKAKSTCTELGFTAGTEKHGECVLKMMDN